MKVSCLNALAAPPRAQRILVIRLGALGDVIRTLPAFHALRAHYADAQIAWLVERKSAGVLEGLSGLDRLLVFPREELRESLTSRDFGELARRVAEQRRTLRSLRLDLVVDFHGILKTGVLSWLTGAPLRAGYAAPFAREGSQLFANRRARLSPARISRYERNAGLLRFLGIPPEPPASVMEATRSLPLDCVILHPGSSEHTPYKRYTVDGYARVARELDRQLGLQSLVTAGPAAGEAEFAEAIVRSSGGAAKRAPGTPRFDDLASLLARARLVIGSDSGPLHAAALGGTPVVQLLGPTDPVENAPYPATPARQVRVPVGCSPCRRGCEAASCMRVIPPERIVQAARELLHECDARVASQHSASAYASDPARRSGASSRG